MDHLERYRTLAMEAEMLAAAASDRQLRRTWKRIAESYRELAVLKAGLHDGNFRLALSRNLLS
jgi:hypothetical protein